MRAFKIAGLIILLTAVAIALTLAWAVRSEQGSRWLVQQGIAITPVTIEASGISGTLVDGLAVDKLYIALPLAGIRATQIEFSWRPASLVAGIVDIKTARISELAIDMLENDSGKDDAMEDQIDSMEQKPNKDPLFWLQLPLQIAIASGQLDKLRIEAAEFEKLHVVGNIGRGRLDIESADGVVTGVRLHASGMLAGPAPGQLDVAASWELLDEDIAGNGKFSGDIEELRFSQTINLPEAVRFDGKINNLFTAPSLTGSAEWQSVRMPGEAVLYSTAGTLAINSDFRSAYVEGGSLMQFEHWPAVPLEAKLQIDPDGMTIDAYKLQALDGEVSGAGNIDFSDGLTGQLEVIARQINTALIDDQIQGQVDFDAEFLLESAAAYVIDVSEVNANIMAREFVGNGRIEWRDEKPAAIVASINAGENRLLANLQLGRILTGTVEANVPELAQIWPGLQGALNASVKLSGRVEKPQVLVAAKATAVTLGQQSLDTFTLNGELKNNNQLDARLVATGLVANQQQLGTLDYTLSGILSDHLAKLKLRGGVVAMELHAHSSWDGEHYTQQFDYGLVQPEGFDSWRLEQQPVLLLSAAGGQVSAHCWRQQQASVCVDASNWDADSFQGAVTIEDFALASLRPLLAEGYSIDGTVDAGIKIIRDATVQQGELHWRQSRTTVGYADDINRFQTVLDEVAVDLVTDTSQTTLSASINGEQGLQVIANARVSGPLAAESPLQASANGSLPNIGLLRPLVQRVFDPGELDGELTLDLAAGGTLGEPLFTGGAYLANGTLGLLDPGVTLTDINIVAESKASDKLKVTGTLRSGEGTADVRGEIRSTENTDLVADIQIQGQNLAAVRVPDLSVDVSPDLKLYIGEGVFDVSGTVRIPRASAEIRDLPRNAVTRSTDVVVHAPDRAIERKQETTVAGDVEVILGDDVRFSGFGLTSRLDGGLRLTQKRGGSLRTGGTVRVRDGFLTGYGRELRVDRGELTFTGPLNDPLINIQVSRETTYEGRLYVIGLRLTGSAQNVKTEPFSRPAMSEQDVLSFLLLNRPASSDSDASGAAIALGLQQLLPDQSGVFGLDEVSFETNDANEAAMVAGKRINDRLFVRYVFGALGQPGSFRIRYTLGRGFSLEASTGANQSMDLIYLLER
jgi:translocation and assembly module TamB